MNVDEAEIWLKQVVKGGLADKETIKAIEVMLRSYNAILTNYNAVEEDMDKQYSKGYQDGFQSVRYDKYINDICGEGESAVKYLIIEREGYIRGYAEAWKRAKEIKEENNEQI